MVCGSPGIFDSAEEAKSDALEKLAALSCQIEQPVAHALHWVLESFGER